MTTIRGQIQSQTHAAATLTWIETHPMPSVRRAPLASALLLLLLQCAARVGADVALPRLEEDDPATLAQILQWSLQHQDLDALHAKAEAIRRGDAAPLAAALGALPAGDGEGVRIRPADPHVDPAAAAARRAELSEVMATMMPDRVAAMREALGRALSAGDDPSAEAAAEPLDALLDVLSPDAADAVRAHADADDTTPAALAPRALARKLLALEDLQAQAEDVDNAQDLLAVGGLAALLPLLAAPADWAPAPTALRAAAAHVLGTCAQNLPSVQAALVEIHAVQPLVAVLLAPPAGAGAGAAGVAEGARAKALFALSAICRDSAAGARALLAHGGLGALAAVAAQPRTRVARKSLTLLTDLARLATDAPVEATAAHATLAAELAAALARNGSALCAAVAAHLAAGAADGDLDAADKGVDAAAALLALAAADATEWSCAVALAPALDALAATADAHGAPTGALAAAPRADGGWGGDDGDGDTDDGVALWRRLGTSARALRARLG
jgi:hypothetical protein